MDTPDNILNYVAAKCPQLRGLDLIQAKQLLKERMEQQAKKAGGLPSAHLSLLAAETGLVIGAPLAVACIQALGVENINHPPGQMSLPEFSST